MVQDETCKSCSVLLILSKPAFEPNFIRVTVRKINN